MTKQSDTIRGKLSTVEELARLLSNVGHDRVTFLVDAAVYGSTVYKRLTATMKAAPIRTLVLQGSGDLTSVLALGDQLAQTDLVVGLGGGSLLDQAKLATLMTTGPEISARLTVPQRCGLIILPAGFSRSTPLIAVPTTVGTGAEASAVACLTYPRGKRLIMGESLRPEAALVTADATRTLPNHLIAEGVLEALFRAVSPYVGDHKDARPQDEHVEDTARHLLRLGYEVRDATRSGHMCSSRLRQEIAELSGSTHNGRFTAGRDPYSVKGWLIANELSSALKIRKVTAVAALLPPLWGAIDAGDERLGSARRLRRLWLLLRAQRPELLPTNPAIGIAELIDSWFIERRVAMTASQASSVAIQTVRAWGAGLPMLGGLDTDDLVKLLGATEGHGKPPGTLLPAI